MRRSEGTIRLFVDEATIQVRAGKGGDGCVSFRREKFIPKGGPDGGDGGRGGSVFLLAQDGIDTLLDLAGRHHWRAENGQPGSGANCHGRNGRDVIVRLPTGTLVYDANSGRLLKDLMCDGQKVRIAAGGRGGHGNTYFASSTNQTPRESQPGGKARERTLRLELKLIADVGLVGLPNAGKSTLLSRMTAARPKIAAYPFTTKTPQLGIVELPDFRRFVVADIPGLIEGAHEGVGLGDAFLRHIERTRVIAHLVDLCPPEGSPTPLEAYQTVRGELASYSAALVSRPEIVVANKMDLTGSEEALADLSEALGSSPRAISGVTGRGIRELAETMWSVVEEARQEQTAAPERIDFGEGVDRLESGDDDARDADSTRPGEQ